MKDAKAYQEARVAKAQAALERAECIYREADPYSSERRNWGRVIHQRQAALAQAKVALDRATRSAARRSAR